jgi:hypothetical protein
MFNYILENREVKEHIIISKSRWITDSDKVRKYARVFFDNVAGRHGRFEIVEPYLIDKGRYSMGYDLLFDRLNSYYKRNLPDEMERKSLGNNWKKAINRFHVDLNSYFNRLNSEIGDYVLEKRENARVWSNCHMLFKDSLYTADIIVGANGEVSMGKEEIKNHFDILEPSIQESLSPQEKDNLEKESTIFLP